MEVLNISFDDARYDELVHNSLPSTADPIEFAVKRRCTQDGKPGVVIAFTAVVGGQPKRVQYTTTFKNIAGLYAGFRGYAAREGLPFA